MLHHVISFCHVHNFTFRGQITQSHFQSLRNPIPKLNSLEFAKALWEATELRLDTDPSHDWTANAADGPISVQHICQFTSYPLGVGQTGFGKWTSEMAGVYFWSPMSTAKLLYRQCLACFSLGCSSTIWTESISIVLNFDSWVQAPFQAKCLQNHCESDSSQPLGLGET